MTGESNSLIEFFIVNLNLSVNCLELLSPHLVLNDKARQSRALSFEGEWALRGGSLSRQLGNSIGRFS